MKKSKYSEYFYLHNRIEKQRGEKINRADLISGFTDGKHDSLKDFRADEYKAFLNTLKTHFNLHDNSDKWDNSPENRMRRKIISIFKQMGYTRDDGKADMNRIQEWCKKYSFTKQELNENSKEQLKKIVYQAEQVYKSYEKSVAS